MVVFFTTCSKPEASALPHKTPASASNADRIRTYSVTQNISLHNLGPGSPDAQNLWVTLIRDFPPYQSAQLRGIHPSKYKLVTDEYGNQYAQFDLSDHPVGTKITVTIDYHVVVYGRRFELGACQGDTLEEFIQPELHIESANPQIKALSEALSRGRSSSCEQVRSFYDYAGDELIYSYNQKDWGAQATFGEMGADCTEYTSLVIALSRAAGIPARYYEGLLYMDNNQGEIAQTEHAWLDVYLPNIGWVPLDPTLGRSLLQRDLHFAQYTPNHIIITTGRNPSTLRGSSYWSHLYWPGERTRIILEEAAWLIEPVN
jgi:transglutaminase-like putative cysteine protease